MAHESHCNEFSMMQGFEHNHELFSIPAGMEILGATSTQQQSFLHRHFPEASNKNLMVPAAETATSVSPWPVADYSSLRSVFNGRPSLSLFNMKHSDAVTVPQPLQLSVSRGHKLQLRAEYLQGQHPFLEDGMGFHQQRPLQLRNTKFLRPAQELLNEFASLLGDSSSKKRPKVEGKPSITSSWHQSLYSMDLLELQKIKAQLLSMLEEVDKRYRRYCEQMRTVVASFEAVAGVEGAARVYSALASKAMSRHFRCLRDGIASHVGAVRKAMGEKDSADTAPPGTTRGETPRLKLLDQCIRQQKAFQQGMITMEQHPWRPQRGLPELAVSTLRAWLFEHFLHPYPNEADKHILSQQTGLSRSQVSNWFINARVRLWKPMVEEMYLEEMKELDKNQTNPATAGQDDSDHNPNPNSNLSFDKKPFADSESVSSIINGNRYGDQIYTDSSSIKNTSLQQQYRQHDGGHRQVPGADNFDAVSDMDYFPYSDCGNSRISRAGVSLTLGLQHHDRGGMILSLLPNSIEEDDQQFQFSILGGEADQNLPYRNLMEAELLHDLAR